MKIEDVIEIVERVPPTQIFSHHDERCEVARGHIIGLDSLIALEENPLEPPTWLIDKYTWGPTRHPIYWCQVIEAKELDCGSLSALVREVYLSRGVKSLPVQLILEYPTHIIEQWTALWRRRGLPINWIWENYVYHEVVGVVLGDCEVMTFDPVERAWIEPLGRVERGNVVAIRVVGEGTCRNLRWGDKRIELNKWFVLR